MSAMQKFDRPSTVTSEIDRELLPTVHELGLASKNFRYIGRKGDLVAFLAQFPLSADDRREHPVLLLANARTPRERRIMFPLRQLWQVVEPRALADVAIPLAQHLYGFVTRDDAFRVLDALLEFAEDLKNAPTPAWISERDYLAALGRDGFVLRRDGADLNE